MKYPRIFSIPTYLKKLLLCNLVASDHNKLKNNFNITLKFLAWAIGPMVVPLTKIGIIGEEEGVVFEER